MMAGAIFSYRMFQRLMMDDKCYFNILDCSEWRWNLVYFDYEILIVKRLDPYIKLYWYIIFISLKLFNTSFETFKEVIDLDD